MDDVAVITDPAAAEASLDPVRAKLLAELTQAPASASALGQRLNIPRQKVNYHLRALERHGLIEFVEERRKGNCMERVLQATAKSYVISPDTLPGLAPQPQRTVHGKDQLSARWLIALAARMVRELAAKPDVPAFGLDGEIRFVNAADRTAFADELSAAIAELVAKYHAGRGRSYRLVVAAHPHDPKEAR